jgi:hypothetical protein
VVVGNASACLVTGLARGAAPGGGSGTGDVPARGDRPGRGSAPGLPAGNVLPAANQHEQTAHEQAASNRIADDAVVLLDANVGQAGVAGNDPPGYLPCQKGASLPTVT